MVLRCRLVVVLGLMLLLGRSACMALCTLETCDVSESASGTIPPCHHHHDNSTKHIPAPCSHQLVVASIVSSEAAPAYLPTVAFATLPVHSSVSFSSLFLGSGFLAQNVSPPGLDSLSYVVLRI
jgi:hypothetical protein